MLCTLIGSHPQALCHHEVFAGAGPVPVFGAYAGKRNASAEYDKRLRNYRETEPQRFLYDVVFDAQGRRCVGFKLKTDEVFLPAYRPVRDLVAADRDIKVIHLIRRNLIDQYVSHRVVETTGVLFLRPNDKHPEVQPFTVDIERFSAFVVDVNARQRAAYDLYRGHRNFTMTFEEIAAPESAALDELQAFLGIDNRPLSSSTKKILRNNRELVLNLDEVEAAWAEQCQRLRDNRHPQRELSVAR